MCIPILLRAPVVSFPSPQSMALLLLLLLLCLANVSSTVSAKGSIISDNNSNITGRSVGRVDGWTRRRVLHIRGGGEEDEGLESGLDTSIDSIPPHSSLRAWTELESRMNTAALPLYDVREDIEKLLENYYHTPPLGGSVDTGDTRDAALMTGAQARSKAELLISRYISSLRDHYFGLYLRGSEKSAVTEDRALLAQRLQREFESAATAALPTSQEYGDWRYIAEGGFLELRLDIAEIDKSLAAFTANEEGDSSDTRSGSNKLLTRHGRLLRVLRKRGKWLAAQLLLFALNTLQSEVNRRMTINSAERRLHQVPEFPLL